MSTSKSRDIHSHGKISQFIESTSKSKSLTKFLKLKIKVELLRKSTLA